MPRTRVGPSGEHRDGRQRLGGVGDVGHVDVDAAQTPRSRGPRRLPSVQVDLGAHPLEHVGEPDVALQRVAAEALDPDPPARDRGRGEEVRRGAGVRLDGVVGSPGSRTVPPDHVPSARARPARRRHASRPRSSRRRAATPAPPVTSTSSPSVGAGRGQQQPGQELARDVRRRPSRVRREPGRGQPGRQVPGPLAALDHLDAEVAQRGEQRSHRPQPERRRRVEQVVRPIPGRAAARGSGRWCPTAARRGGPALPGRARRPRGRGRGGRRDRSRAPTPRSVRAASIASVSSANSTSSRLEVPSARAAATQGPVGDALGPRHAHDGVGRHGERRRRVARGHGRSAGLRRGRAGPGRRVPAAPGRVRRAATRTSSAPRPPATAWRIARSSTLMPASPSAVVATASAPGPVVEGDDEVDEVAVGRLRDQPPPGVAGAREHDLEAVVVARHERLTDLCQPGLVARRVRRARRRGCRARMPRHSSGSDAAIRVVSRNPPPATASTTSPASAAASAATSARALAASCGRWLTSATSSSCRAGASASTRAPMRRSRLDTSGGLPARWSSVGVSTHVAPWNRVASAASARCARDPAIGWPPTNRAGSSPAPLNLDSTSMVKSTLRLATSVRMQRRGARAGPPRRPGRGPRPQAPRPRPGRRRPPPRRGRRRRDRRARRGGPGRGRRVAVGQRPPRRRRRHGRPGATDPPTSPAPTTADAPGRPGGGAIVLTRPGLTCANALQVTQERRSRRRTGRTMPRVRWHAARHPRLVAP